MAYVDNIDRIIQYCESNIYEDINGSDVIKALKLSNHYQRAFHIITNYTINEYIRNRKLFLAASDLASSDYTILEIALKYGFDTEEGFRKAFYRFHGVNPSVIKKHPEYIKSFLPLLIKLQVTGGERPDSRIIEFGGFDLLCKKTTFYGYGDFKKIEKYLLSLKEEKYSKSGIKTKHDNIYEYGAIKANEEEPIFDYYVGDIIEDDDDYADWTRIHIKKRTWLEYSSYIKSFEDTNALFINIFSVILPVLSNIVIDNDYIVVRLERIEGKKLVYRVLVPIEEIKEKGKEDD